MTQRKIISLIDDMGEEIKDLRRELERTSRKLSQVQQEKKELQKWINRLTTKDHPARRDGK
jgi:septal ring factor EnvC (AmiA/AmiB activator)